MLKVILFIAMLLPFQRVWAECHAGNFSRPIRDTIEWITVKTDSGIVHAAVAMPAGKGPFPAIIILHGTHGFAQEYVQLARQFANNGFVGIAACWFAGRKGEGVRFITPIDFQDAPPFIDVAGLDRFRIARRTIDSLVQCVGAIPLVQKGHLAIFGHSRGAGAALDYALTHPDKVQALILNSGGYPPEVTRRVPEMSIPLLLLHGTADNPTEGGSTFTNIEMVRGFETALRVAKKEVEVKYLEGSGHNALFRNAAQLDSTVRRVSKFLRKRFAG